MREMHISRFVGIIMKKREEKMEVSRTAFKSDMNIFGCSGQRVMSERVVSGLGFGADRQMHDTHMTRGAVAL